MSYKKPDYVLMKIGNGIGIGTFVLILPSLVKHDQSCRKKADESDERTCPEDNQDNRHKRQKHTHECHKLSSPIPAADSRRL
jgi:hypothetical protein